jgi:hypothetical protein
VTDCYLCRDLRLDLTGSAPPRPARPAGHHETRCPPPRFVRHGHLGRWHSAAGLLAWHAANAGFVGTAPGLGPAPGLLGGYRVAGARGRGRWGRRGGLGCYLGVAGLLAKPATASPTGGARHPSGRGMGRFGACAAYPASRARRALPKTQSGHRLVRLKCRPSVAAPQRFTGYLSPVPFLEARFEPATEAIVSHGLSGRRGGR